MLMQAVTGNGNFFTENAALIDTILQLLLIIIPIFITWYIRTYVKGTTAEKKVAAIVNIANAAMDYTEALDNRGEFDTLKLSPEFSKGLHKLNLASEWMEQELKRSGIEISNEEAQKWITSEFQKRVGDVQMVGSIAESACAAIELVQSLERNGLIELPPDADRVAQLAELAADWVVAQLAQQGVSISRQEALIWVRAELLNAIQMQIDTLPTNERLANLANQAVIFLKELKDSGQLVISGKNVETDIATAWLLTEAAKQGLLVTTGDVASALNVAMQ